MDVATAINVPHIYMLPAEPDSVPTKHCIKPFLNDNNPSLQPHYRAGASGPVGPVLAGPIFELMWAWQVLRRPLPNSI